MPEAATITTSNPPEGKNITIVTLSGSVIELDFIDEMKKILFSLAEDQNCAEIIIDFSEVRFFSSVALATLIITDKKLKARGAHLVLFGAIGGVYELFAITKLNRFFHFTDTLQDALLLFQLR